MHSVLFKIGPLAIRGYGLMLALSFLFGTYLAVSRGRRVGVDPKRMTDLAFLIIVSAVVGARLFYVGFHLDEFSDNPLDIINPFGGSQGVGISGLVFYGGLIFAVLASILYALQQRISFWKLADLIAPSLALGIFLTRIGCFLNGCCFGNPSDLPWALTFPRDSPAGFVFPGVRIHPAQLYSSLYGLVILGALLFLERFKRFDGFTFWLFVAFYSIARFSVDFVRYYDSMILFGSGGVQITVNQGMSVGLFILACVMFWVASLRRTERIP